MKKIGFIALLLLYVLFSKAQSGLQFNQARFLPVSFTTAGGTVNLGTVPSGKVWKLEQAVGTVYALNNYSFHFNGVSTNYAVPSGNSYSMNDNSLWWPAGTVIDVYIQSASSANSVYFNILEFNVVQ